MMLIQRLGVRFRRLTNPSHRRRLLPPRPTPFAVFWGSAFALLSQLNAAVLPHSPLVPTAAELAPLARVRALLADSTAAHRNPVRIVFYGQSITLGPWWQQVASELRRLYPYADLQIENRAISGFQDWALARTVHSDLLPLQPDLVIFHAYGTGSGTDDLLRQLRAGTTADILVQTDHPHEDSALNEETAAEKLTPAKAIPYRNYVGLPADTRRHDAALAQVRNAWKAYCWSNSLAPSSLLVDGIHPNADGYQLMAEFVLAYLQPSPEPPAFDPWNCARVQSLEIGRDAFWKSNALECEFTGSSLFCVLASKLNGEMEVWIDGQRAASRPELLDFNRVSPTHFSSWPTLTRVDSRQPLLEEEWTLTPHSISTDGQFYGFSVSGSRTGPDGEGTNTARFVSRSGRVMIEPWDHWLSLSVYFSKGVSVPAGFSARWQVERHFLDPIPAGWTPPTAGGNSVRLVQGLADGPHRLRLVMPTGSPAPLTRVRTHSPSGRAAIRGSPLELTLPEGQLQIMELARGLTLAWTDATDGWQLESCPILLAEAGWRSVDRAGIETSASSNFLSLLNFSEATFFRLTPKSSNSGLTRIRDEAPPR